MLNRINPLAIRIGDQLWQHGCLFEVKEVNAYCYTVEELHRQPSWFNVIDRTGDGERRSNDLTCYVAKGSFVSGRIAMFEWFRSTISAGPNCGAKEEYTSLQGNRLAVWERET